MGCLRRALRCKLGESLILAKDSREIKTDPFRSTFFRCVRFPNGHNPATSYQWNHLKLLGSKYGRAEGQCGACTVLSDGKARRSCITRLGNFAQKQITTIEGLAKGDQLHPVPQAFLDEGAMQCPYCTSV